MLAGALVGRHSARPVAERLRHIVPDTAVLICGVAIMLVWAGIVEGFFSQYHAPVIPYEAKIAFGIVELGLLTLFFQFSGKRPVAALTWRRIRGWVRRVY
jgi:ABC-type glucose/galactose transport system permease subunit